MASGWRVERRGEDLAVSYVGRMCGHPSRSAGCVAPCGLGAFTAVGTLAEVILAYRAWVNHPITSIRGDVYPRRGFLGANRETIILSAFAEEFGWEWPDALKRLGEVAP